MFAPTPPPPWGGRADCSAIRYFHREIASQQVFGLKPAGTANSGPRWARLRPARLQEKPQHVSANVAANIRNLYCNNYGYEVASLRRPKAAARAALRAAICRRKFLRCLFNSIYQSAPPFVSNIRGRPPPLQGGRADCLGQSDFFAYPFVLKSAAALSRAAASPWAMPPSAAHSFGVNPAAAEGDFNGTDSAAEKKPQLAATDCANNCRGEYLRSEQQQLSLQGCSLQFHFSRRGLIEGGAKAARRRRRGVRAPWASRRTVGGCRRRTGSGIRARSRRCIGWRRPSRRRSSRPVRGSR